MPRRCWPSSLNLEAGYSQEAQILKRILDYEIRHGSNWEKQSDEVSAERDQLPA